MGVSISSAATKPDAKPTTFKDLSERALASYVNALLALKPASAEELRKNLAAPIKSSKKEGLIEDLTTMERTLAVTVAKTDFNPVDRLVFTRIEIALDNAEFTNWTAAKTEYETYDLGTLKSERSLSFEATADIMTGGPNAVLPKVGTKTTAASTRNEELAAKQRVEILTTEFNSGKIIVTRQGEMGIDLTGTTLLDVAVVPKLTQINHTIRFTADGLETDPKKKDEPAVSLTPHPTAEPNIKGPITATVTLSCRLRHITAGDATLEEKDDIVDFKKCGATVTGVVIVPARDDRVPAWGLVGYGLPSDDKQVYARYTSTKVAALCFSSYEEADAFLDYLEAHPTNKIGATELVAVKIVAGTPSYEQLSFKSAPKLQVESCIPGG